MLILKSESLRESLIYQLPPPLRSLSPRRSSCYYYFHFLSKSSASLECVLVFRGLGSCSGLIAGPSPPLPESGVSFPRLISLRASLMAALGPLPPPRLVPGGPAVLRCAATLGSVHLPPAYSRGQWKLRPPATASGPALPDPVPEIRSSA